MNNNKEFQPKTGQACGCRKGVQRDNCPNCEGTGMVVDFKAIRERALTPQHTPTPDAYKGLSGLDMTSLEIILRRTFHDKAVEDIVRAVNSFDSLVDTLKIALDQGEFTPRVRKILEDEIAKAEGSATPQGGK